jgi:predicted outer membrane protein
MLTLLPHKVVIAGVMLVLGLSSLAVAQQQPAPRQPAFPPANPPATRQAPAQVPGQAARPAQAQGNRMTDHILEQCLIIENQAEVEIAKFAQEHAHSEDVKLFATMMIQDHSDFVNSLQQFHQQHSGQPAAARPAPAGGVAQAPQQAQPQQPQQGGFNFLAIKQEIGKECVASFKKKFGELDGKQFDTCYMAHMVSAHMHMLDTLKVFKRHASPELAQLIQGGIATSEDHLMHAMNMVKEFGGPTAETVRRPAEERK